MRSLSVDEVDDREMDTVDDELDQIKDSIGRLNPLESKAQDSTRWDQGRFRDHDR